MSQNEIVKALELEVGTPLGLLNESHLIDILRDSIFPDLKKSVDFARWDCTFNRGEISIELKCRRKHYSELRLEETKYRQQVQFSRHFYCCSTPSGIFIWDLDEIDPHFEMKPNQLTSELKGKSKEIVLKSCVDLPIRPKNDITKIILEKLTGIKILPPVKTQPIF